MVLIGVVAVLLAALALYFPISRLYVRNNVKRFALQWDKTLANGELEMKTLSDVNHFVSDRSVLKFCERYKELVTAYGELKVPTELRNEMKRYDEFCLLYHGVDQLQFNTNVVYFRDRLPGLELEYQKINDSSRFVAYHEISPFETRWKKLIKEFNSLRDKEAYKDCLSEFSVICRVANDFFGCKYNFDTIRKSNNSLYMVNEKDQCKEYFDKIFSYPLDEQQRDAIVSCEDNTLVISSAGSGKTSTIIGKVKYLMERKGISPDKILVLTYTRKAAEELRERVGDESVECSTFHKHAMKTIANATGKWPTIADSSLLYNVFNDLLRNNKAFFKSVNKYITKYANLLKDDFAYKSARDVVADKQKYGIKAPYRDASGQIKFVKSKQELEIFVILTHLGIKFTYEEKYPYETADRNHKQYKPDFTIYYEAQGFDELGRPITITKRLFYEHFGINANGNVPEWFGDGMEGGYEAAQRKYVEGIVWKRSIHAEKRTDMIETTSADFFRESDMESYIRALLERRGVPVKPISEEVKHRLLQDCNPGVDQDLFKLAEGFIMLMKANRKTVDELIENIGSEEEYAERNRFVLDNIIKPVYDGYTQRLHNQEQMDFTDTLLQATNLCTESAIYDFEYILVDEFQDMSIDKYAYLISIRSKTRYTPMFCVGDDWQSIYRFSGSDMTLFYDFEQHFGYTQKCKLETTHRFGNPLLSMSSEFIQRNPEQLTKDIQTTSRIPSTMSLMTYDDTGVRAKVEEIISKIPSGESIYILGRYFYNVRSLGVRIDDDAQRSNSVKLNICGRDVTFMTVHSSKGLEADNVIILECNGGVHGFPSMITDDPILNYVLSGADSFENAEERRVFYVAITRAKKMTYCLYDRANPSVFMNEFGIFRSRAEHENITCHRCGSGYVRKIREGVARNGNEFMLVGCTNTMCDYFETLFGEDVNKYKPREVIRVFDFPRDEDGNLKCQLHTVRELYPLGEFKMIGNPDICIVMTTGTNRRFTGVPIFFNANLELNENIIQAVKNNDSRYEAVVLRHWNHDVIVLRKTGDDICLTNQRLNEITGNAMGFSGLHGANLDNLIHLVRLGLANPLIS